MLLPLFLGSCFGVFSVLIVVLMPCGWSFVCCLNAMWLLAFCVSSYGLQCVIVGIPESYFYILHAFHNQTMEFIYTPASFVCVMYTVSRYPAAVLPYVCLHQCKDMPSEGFVSAPYL